MAPKTRPSRLLNLNKSPTVNRKISVSNASNSPFLILPPELRHRIYRYALGDKVIHIFGRLKDRNATHHLAICTNPPVDDRNERRKHVYDREEYPGLNLSDSGLHFTVLQNRYGHEIIRSDDHPHNQCTLQSSNLRPHLPLQLLQVCRQIYGEAVLISFTRNAFIASAQYREDGLRALLATLVPVQVRAIAHLILVAHDDYLRYKPYSSSAKLEGLRSLHLVLSDHDWDLCRGSSSLKHLKLARFNALSQLDLKSVRFTYTFERSTFDRSSTESILEEIEEFMVDREKEFALGPDAYLARRKAEDERLHLVEEAK